MQDDRWPRRMNVRTVAGLPLSLCRHLAGAHFWRFPCLLAALPGIAFNVDELVTHAPILSDQPIKINRFQQA